MSGFIHDIRYGLRQLKKSPGFAAAAALFECLYLASISFPYRATRVDPVLALRFE
jgi:hypothetical protein